MKKYTVPVKCGTCGKRLRGTPSLVRGFHVWPHKNHLTGKPCWGAKSTDHAPIHD